MAVKTIEVDLAVKHAAEVKASIDDIGARAEALKKNFPAFALKIDKVAASETLRVFRAEMADATKTRTATVKVKVDDSALQKLQKDVQKLADSSKSGGPGLLISSAALLTPAIGTAAGVTAAAGIGLAGAAVAGTAALAAFGAVAKPVLSDTLKAQSLIVTAQNNYTAAIQSGVKPAVAYKAEQLAINKAYANLGPQQIALTNQLMAMANAWDDLKNSLTPVVSGALQPWLKSVTDLTKNLAPIIFAVSPVIKGLGTQFDALINSPAFKAFRDFIANTGSKAVGAIGGTLIDFLKAGMILLVDFNPLIEKAVGWIGALGPAVLKWASSKKTADDITKFMDWFNTNGPVVGGLLKNIGAALKNLAPGLTAGGAIELKVISDFFGWVAKLPKGIATPLAEVAGALLILNKLGVFSVGVKFVGLAAGWITKLLGGATVELGAAGMQRAGNTMGAAAVAMQRAADTMVGADAGAAGKGAAGGAAGKGAAGAGAGGAAAGGAAALGVATAGALIGAMIRAVGDALSPAGSFAGALNKDLQNLGTPISTSLLHAFTFGGLEAKLTTEIGAPVGAVENNILAGAKIWGGNIASTFAGTWTNIQRGAVLWWHNIAGGISGAWTGILGGAKIWGTSIASSISGTWTNIRGGAVIAWNGIWSAITSAVTRGISAVVGFFTGLPGKIVSALSSLGVQLAAVGRAALSQLLAGAQSAVGGITSFFSSFASGIVGIFKKIWGWFSPSSVMYQGGKSLMEGLALGIKDHAHLAVAHAQAAAGATAGAAGSSGGAVAALMKQMAAARGWTGAQWNALYALEMNEAGFSLTARNPSGAYGLAQFINGPSEYAQYGGNANTAAGQITGMLNYIAQRYGTPAAAWAFEKSHVPNWYGSGLDAMFSRPTLIGVGERGPERVQVTPARSGSQDPLAAKLDQLIAEVRHLTNVAGEIPARTGQHVAAGVNGAAAAASFRVRYP